MCIDRLRSNSPQLLVGFGAVLFLIASLHHATELFAIEGVVGPAVAWLLDGALALALVYAGYWLAGTELSTEDRWRVFVWSLLGAALFAAIVGLSLLIRAFEGRVVGEAIFPLLIAAEAGGLAGALAGYQTGRARTEARRAQTVSEALGFVNSLIRHDLRNDLNVIQGRARLLEGQADDGDTDGASVIARKADEALARLETTGTVAKTLSGDAELEPTDIATIAGEMATQVEVTYDTTVETELPDRALVTANKGIRSVVDNLLENAVEHNDADEPEIRVEVDVQDDTVVLAVADNGPGLSDEQKARVLETKGEQQGGGGLSLVRTLVEGYGGEVRIEDNSPRGSVFVLELPRASRDGA